MDVATKSNTLGITHLFFLLNFFQDRLVLEITFSKRVALRKRYFDFATTIYYMSIYPCLYLQGTGLMKLRVSFIDTDKLEFISRTEGEGTSREISNNVIC